MVITMSAEYYTADFGAVKGMQEAVNTSLLLQTRQKEPIALLQNKSDVACLLALLEIYLFPKRPRRASPLITERREDCESPKNYSHRWLCRRC
jgi:hypothetical protein